MADEENQRKLFYELAEIFHSNFDWVRSDCPLRNHLINSQTHISSIVDVNRNYQVLEVEGKLPEYKKEGLLIHYEIKSEKLVLFLSKHGYNLLLDLVKDKISSEKKRIQGERLKPLERLERVIDSMKFNGYHLFDERFRNMDQALPLVLLGMQDGTEAGQYLSIKRCLETVMEEKIGNMEFLGLKDVGGAGEFFSYAKKCGVESDRAKHLLKQKLSSFKKDLRKELQELEDVLSK